MCYTELREVECVTPGLDGGGMCYTEERETAGWSVMLRSWRKTAVRCGLIRTTHMDIYDKVIETNALINNI